MAAYRIRMFNADGSLNRETLADYACDDDAIDRTGEIQHLETIFLWQGERLVATFPPWGVLLPTLH